MTKERDTVHVVYNYEVSQALILCLLSAESRVHVRFVTGHRSRFLSELHRVSTANRHSVAVPYPSTAAP
jgi:hypothetical protein